MSLALVAASFRAVLAVGYGRGYLFCFRGPRPLRGMGMAKPLCRNGNHQRNPFLFTKDKRLDGAVGSDGVHPETVMTAGY